MIMTQPVDSSWKSVNTEYLAAVAQWVHANLEIFILDHQDAPKENTLPTTMPIRRKTGFLAWLFGETGPIEPQLPQPDPATHPTTEQKKNEWSATKQKSEKVLAEYAGDLSQHDLRAIPSFARLRWLFNLTSFEEHVLRLCLSAELKHVVDSLCARAQADTRRPYPTLNLALQLFNARHEDYAALSTTGALRYWSLVEVIQPSGTRLFDAALRIDGRILAYCLQENSLDEWLLTFGQVVAGDSVPNPMELSSGHREAISEILNVWNTRTAPPNISLVGPDAISKLAIVVHAANHLEKHLFRIPVEQLPTIPADVDQLARNWTRERILQPLSLYLDGGDEFNSSPSKDTEATVPERTTFTSLRRFLNRVPSGVTIGTIDNSVHTRSVIIEASRPTPIEQSKIWKSALKFSDEQYSGRLATQFNLDESSIRAVSTQIPFQANGNSQDLERIDQARFERAWDICRIRTRPRVDGLAQQIQSLPNEVALVLSDDARQQLDELEAQVKNRWRVYDDWGLRDRLSRGLGIAAMFVGESGTGKTSAATEIANHLKLDLFRIDLSAVINKYIGETEKNLRRVFDAFEDCGAVLFFDECDAIFGKRTEVKDSHDRYANIEVSYLLQRIESYHGLAILATNKAGAIDSAFLRRLRFVINFPYPTLAQRKEIWHRLLPSQGKPPTDALNYDWLAAFDKLTGGTIHSASMHAAFLAAQRHRKAIVMEDVRDAIKAEYMKLNLPLRASELQLPAPVARATASVSSMTDTNGVQS